MTDAIGHLRQVNLARSPRNGRLVLSFEVVGDTGLNRSLEAARRIIQVNAGSPVVFEIGRTYGITDRLDVLMIATAFPHGGSPLRLEMIYAPENNRKAASPTEREALLDVADLLVSKRVVPQADADELTGRITCETTS